MKSTLRTILPCLLLVPAQTGAAPPRVPAGKWAVEYQEDTCTLSRDGPRGLPGVAIRTRPLAVLHDLMFFGPLRGHRKVQFQARIALVPSNVAIDRWVFIERSPSTKMTLVKMEITRAELGHIGEAKVIHLTGPDEFALQAPLPPMTKALAALRECEVYLAGRWGITPAEMQNWAQPARAVEDLRNLFWSKDMSDVAMLRSDSVRGVLDIDTAGVMIGCRIVQPSRISWVNAKFCQTLRERARFEPARNSAGAAVPGKVITPPIRSVRLR